MLKQSFVTLVYVKQILENGGNAIRHCFCQIKLFIINAGITIRTFYLVLFFCISSLISAQPIFENVVSEKDTVDLFEKFEINLTLNADYQNPYNPDEVILTAEFLSPSGKIKIVDGFYYIDYKIINEYGKLEKAFLENWKVRFTPDEPGTWAYNISCKDKKGITSYIQQFFFCSKALNKGFIRKSNTNYLRFDDGSQFFAIGENIGWYSSRRIYDYKKWIDALAEHGGNYMRIWMCSWATALEWNDTGLGDYTKRMDRAYELDWIINYAVSRNIYVQLCLNNHGQVSTYVNSQWRENPYNAINGGPCKNTWEFFTDSTAIKFYLQKLKYIVARWGYSPNILAWEIFNEIEFTNFFHLHKDEIIDWHILNARYLDSLDINNHLISTSLGAPAENHKLWNHPEISFTQTHIYSGEVNIESVLLDYSKNFLAFYRKPTLVGEFGLSLKGESLNQVDSLGIHIHNSLWSSIVSGAFGTSMTWWWDSYIDPHNLYSYYKPLSEFVNNTNYIEQAYQPSDNIICQTNDKSDLLFSPGSPEWGRSPNNYFIITNEGIQPAISELGSYLFGQEWWNSELRNPITFRIINEDSCNFTFLISDTTIDSRISVVLDGKELINRLARRDSIYSILIPKGDHKIQLDNPGSGFIKISNYEVSNCIPAVKGFLSRGKTCLIGWLHNRNYNWRSVRLKKNIKPVEETTVTIDNVPDGEYHIDLFDCASGILTQSFVKNAESGKLIFPVKIIKWDVAFKINYVGHKQTAISFTRDKLKISPPINLSGISYLDIQYFVEDPGITKILINKYTGDLVDVILNEYTSPGNYELYYNSDHLKPGFYFINMTSGKNSTARKFVVN